LPLTTGTLTVDALTSSLGIVYYLTTIGFDLPHYLLFRVCCQLW
jgi:hypothetical protein